LNPRITVRYSSVGRKLSKLFLAGSYSSNLQFTVHYSCGSENFQTIPGGFVQFELTIYSSLQLCGSEHFQTIPGGFVQFELAIYSSLQLWVGTFSNYSWRVRTVRTYNLQFITVVWVGTFSNYSWRVCIVRTRNLQFITVVGRKILKLFLAGSYSSNLQFTVHYSCVGRKIFKLFLVGCTVRTSGCCIECDDSALCTQRDYKTYLWVHFWA
jgi:hypothetical protein